MKPPTRHAGKRRRWPLLGLIAALLLGGCSASRATQKASPIPAAAASSGAVSLTAVQARRIGLATASVALAALDGQVSTTGTITLDTDREAQVTSPLNARVLHIDVSVGDRVRKGQRLALLDSADLAQAQSDYLQASADLVLAQKDYAREKGLLAANLAARKDYVQAAHDFETAEVAAERTRNQLLIDGLQSAQISKLAVSHRIDSQIALLAPLSGDVTARQLTVGAMVGPTAAVFTLDDLVHPWALLDVYEKDLGGVHKGESVAMTTLAYPGRIYHGIVDRVGDILDPSSHTAKARVLVDNATGDLKAGMYVRARIRTPARRMAAVPVAAVVHDDKGALAFRVVGPDRFEAVRVEVGPESHGLVGVSNGLATGDVIVSYGALEIQAAGQ
ncbi:MAG: efflux RND transporter periplasmic adaptor subunit [Cyanobacteria bacterium REEB65]|nr:efflux RND transporter periplasmic adaptor subunit [Cyanobacteria bacterium REEB65]